MKMDENRFLRFFVVSDAPVLMESIYCESYKDFKCCSIRKDDIICIFFTDINLSNTQNIGLELLVSDLKFQKYVADFSELLNSFSLDIDYAIQNKDALSVINYILKFLSFYRYTEFFYTDKAFSTQDDNFDNAVLKRNLLTLGSLKYSARTVLNSIFMGSNSYICQLAKKYNGRTNILNMRIPDIFNNQSSLIYESTHNHILLYNQKLLSENSKEYEEAYALYFANREKKKIIGIPASKGRCYGRAFVLSSDFSNYESLDLIIENMPENSILVSETTSPELIRACHKALGIITNQGGIGSHAAIISRELKIPCLVGTGNATSIIKTGDILVLDGNSGYVVIQ